MRVRNILLFTLVIVFVISATETGFRIVDGYSLRHLRLVKNERGTFSISNREKDLFQKTKDYVLALPVTNEVNRAWFEISPRSEIQFRVSDSLVKRLRRATIEKGGTGQAPRMVMCQWNRKWLREIVCTQKKHQNIFRFFPSEIFVYDPPNESLYPHYRFFPNFRWNRFSTNNYGFRGRDISIDKPEKTIRIAFAGSSTTANNWSHNFSYPEYIEHWLNIWSKTNDLGINFEIINGGRPGIKSNNIRSIVEYELLPFEPDFVVYYEGSNQFRPDSIVKFIEDPNSYSKPPKPIPDTRSEAGSLQQPYKRTKLAQWSALVRRIYNLVAYNRFNHAKELKKPKMEIVWPEGVDEFNPDPSLSNLPLNLNQILDDIDNMRLLVEKNGGRFVLCSFVWMVEDGMLLHPTKNWGVFHYLNEIFWPFTYSVMRRAADFQNRVFRNYSKIRDLPFLEIDAIMPHDPDLFIDAIHMTEPGVRLRAWITFNNLLPFIKSRIRSGDVPRSDRYPLASHPYIKPPQIGLFPCILSNN